MKLCPILTPTEANPICSCLASDFIYGHEYTFMFSNKRDSAKWRQHHNTEFCIQCYCCIGKCKKWKVPCSKFLKLHRPYPLLIFTRWKSMISRTRRIQKGYVLKILFKLEVSIQTGSISNIFDYYNLLLILTLQNIS